MSDLILLLDLPDEMLGEISNHLNVSSARCWRMSCRRVRGLVRPPVLSMDWFKLFPGLPLREDRMFRVWRSHPDQGTRMLVKIIYQAAWDEHMGLLHFYRDYYSSRVTCTVQEEITFLHTLKCIASMRGSDLVWEYMTARRPILGDECYKNNQYMYIAAGYGQLDFIRDTLGIWTGPMFEALISFSNFDKDQKNICFRCPDPLHMMAQNGLFYLMDRVIVDWKGRFDKLDQKIALEYVRKHNTVCLAYGHLGGMVFNCDDLFQPGPLQWGPFILSHGTTTKGLDWLLSNRYLQPDLGLGVQWLEILCQRERKDMFMFLNWFADHCQATNWSLLVTLVNNPSHPFLVWFRERMKDT